MSEEKFQVQVTNIRTISVNLPAQLIVDFVIDLINGSSEAIEELGNPVNRDNLAALNLGNLPLGGMNDVIASLSYQDTKGTIKTSEQPRVTAHSRQVQNMVKSQQAKK